MRVSQKLRFRKRERGKTVVLVWRSFQFFVRSLSKETCALILEREREREGEYDRISEGGSVDFWPLGGTFRFLLGGLFYSRPVPCFDRARFVRPRLFAVTPTDAGANDRFGPRRCSPKAADRLLSSPLLALSIFLRAAPSGSPHPVRQRRVEASFFFFLVGHYESLKFGDFLYYIVRLIGNWMFRGIWGDSKLEMHDLSLINKVFFVHSCPPSGPHFFEEEEKN